MTEQIPAPHGEVRQERRSRSRPDRQSIGKIGENLAADFVVTLGWDVLQRNWRCRYGELDVIAVNGSTLVIVEVKTRASDFYTNPAEAVTPNKLARMRRLTRIWLGEQERRLAHIRFDVIAVQLDRLDPADTSRAGLRHHIGVFA